MKKIFSILMVALFSASLSAANVKIYFVNADNWETVYVHAWKTGTGDLKAWPGTQMTKTGEQVLEKDIYEAELPEEYVDLLFHNNAGTQTSDLKFDAATPYYYNFHWYATAADVEAAGAVVKNKIYFVNADGWTNVYVYTWNGDVKLKAWPGTQMTKTGEQALEKDVYEAELPEEFTNVIFNNNDGAQTGDLTFDAAKPYYYDKQWFASLDDLTPYVPALTDGYYLVGKFNGVDAWGIADLDASKLFTPNNDKEYKLQFDLKVDDQLKVFEVKNDEFVGYYPAGTGNDYKVDAKHAADGKTIYFRPDGEGGEGWYEGVIFIAENEATAVDNTATTVKAVKSLENGMLIIEKNGVRYNAQGQIVK